ncbi:hypothetical protein [Streptomyces sp. SID8352]|uniref:hypothetical protein n=1 Tax=Streptomyces sp. SID8352 TaxID=2690338 RepID=UPI00136B3FA4|nr:hypothetical protein [Streptomyces sp. SID8352]MYU24614.1 hypothetical protein [Streptomyces sp. SID8352]
MTPKEYEAKRRLLSARAARAIIDAADVVKAPDWPDTRAWHVVSGGEVLVVISPFYGGGSRTGWRWWLAALGPSGDSRHETTIRQAAARGLADWERWVTEPRR